jgi:hypothetical protein
MSSSSRMRSRNPGCESAFLSWSQANLVLSVSRNWEGTVTFRAGSLMRKSCSTAERVETSQEHKQVQARKAVV